MQDAAKNKNFTKIELEAEKLSCLQLDLIQAISAAIVTLSTYNQKIMLRAIINLGIPSVLLPNFYQQII
jgi:hypothetical protein